MTFEEDLTKRRIDVAAFAIGEPNRFAEWQQMYAQMHPNSFYISVKMVLNDVRRKFWLAEAVKPLVPVTAEAPAKPAVRRAAIPGAAKPIVPAPETAPDLAPPAEQPESKPTPPVRGRAVIRKPASPSPELSNPPETKPPVMPEVAAETSPVPSASRPRPVIRRPAPTAAEETPVNQEHIAEDKTNHEAPFHTNPDPETEAPVPKPPRPRPVIKRPAALSETTAGNIIAVPPTESKPESNNLITEPEPASEPINATSPRPRPVMRRPLPTTPEEGPATPTPAGKPVGEEPTEEPELAAKPPRPRPVFKRPSKPDSPAD